MRAKLKILARIWPDGSPFRVTGQEAHALRLLVERGRRGLAAWDVPGGPPWRLAAYCHDLRRNFGLPIRTDFEPHVGGRHARYWLEADVEILDVIEPRGGRDSA